MDSKRSFITNLTIITTRIFFFQFCDIRNFGEFSNKIAKVVEFIYPEKTTKFVRKKFTRLPEASFRLLVPATVKKKHSAKVKKKRHFNYRNRNHSPTQRKNRKSFITRSRKSFITVIFALYHENLPPAMVKNYSSVLLPCTRQQLTPA
jgi:hypothetical protein